LDRAALTQIGALRERFHFEPGRRVYQFVFPSIQERMCTGMADSHALIFNQLFGLTTGT
jgi:hypothetical protein